jgi:hypothetical protein
VLAQRRFGASSGEECPPEQLRVPIPLRASNQLSDLLELATVEWIAWFNDRRLHEALGDIPAVEFEQLHAGRIDPNADNGSIAVPVWNVSDGLRTRRSDASGLEIGPEPLLQSYNGRSLQTLPATTAPEVGVQRTPTTGLSDE